MKKKFYITIFLCGLFTSSQAKMLTQNFDVQIGVFDAAKVKVAYNLSPDYTFFCDIQTAGLFDTFYSFNAQYTTKGEFKDNTYITKDYHQKTKSSAHIRTKRLAFDEKGILKYRVSSKDGVEKTVDVASVLSADVYDLQTVLLMMLSKFEQTQSCNLQKTVFNSKKIYHIRIEDEGDVNYANKKTPFKGQAHKCQIFIHQEKAEKGDLLWQISAEKSIVFYLMKDEKTGLFFVPEIEISSTPLGDLKAYLKTYQLKE